VVADVMPDGREQGFQEVRGQTGKLFALNLRSVQLYCANRSLTNSIKPTINVKIGENLENGQMILTGGCHCGAIRYEASGEAITHALCHCTDCRRCAGAPAVSWTMYKQDAVKITKGEPKIYASSENARRHFCGQCGTGLFYVNETVLPGIIDIQVAERINWMKTAHELPEFERFPVD
jgi:hypothetical protein